MPERTAGDALVKMQLAGVCDTDLQLQAGYMGFAGIPGHEFVGEVLQADADEWLGRRVVADINAGCGRCADCLERDGHHCAARTVLGIAGRSGAFAEQLVVPEHCLVAVPPTVRDEQAVFAEPLAAALHVLDAIPPHAKTQTVAVLGDGKLGLLISMALAAAGLRACSIGHHPHKLALLPPAIQTRLEAELSDERFSVVVDATGNERGIDRALALVEPRGIVVLKTTTSERPRVDLSRVVVNEISLLGSRCGNMRAAMKLLALGTIDPSPLIQARHPLHAALDALEQARTPGALKILIEGSTSTGE